MATDGIRPAENIDVQPRIERVRAADAATGAVIVGLTAAEVGQPSRLPDWTVGHVVSHLARNADGLGNLLRWASTGVETPMYASSQDRDAKVQAGAGRPVEEIQADYRNSCDALASAIDALPAQAWSAQVRTRTGGPIPAATVLDHRFCELLLHHHDLGVDSGLAELPADQSRALLAALQHTYLRTHEVARIELAPTDAEPLTIGATAAGSPTEVSGPAWAIAGWLTGRTSGEELTFGGPIPALPTW